MFISMERGIKKACKHNFKFPERKISEDRWSLLIYVCEKIVLLSICKDILSVILFFGLTRVSVLLPLHSVVMKSHYTEFQPCLFDCLIH